MKPYLFTVLILLSVVVIATLCKIKLKTTPDDLYSFENTLSGVMKILPVSSAYSLILVHGKGEQPLYTRYVLAPRHQCYPQVATDTILIINDKSSTDSIMQSIASNKKILWQNTDSHFAYTLVCMGHAQK